MKQTGHKSRAMVDRYVRSAELFKDNAGGSWGCKRWENYTFSKAARPTPGGFSISPIVKITRENDSR
jgi:hypothetical protein